MVIEFVLAGVVSHIVIIVMVELLLLVVLLVLVMVRNFLDLAHEIVHTILLVEFCMLFCQLAHAVFNLIAGILIFYQHLYPSSGHILDDVALATNQYDVDVS